MKRFFLASTCAIITMGCYSQDFMVKKDGTIIQAKVVEIGTSEIKYKKWSNQDGPSYAILKTDILAITYQNGEKETFEEATQSKRNEQQPTSDRKPLLSSSTTTGQNTLISSSQTGVTFTPAQDLTPVELEARINEINPYVLYRKGSVAEYKFQQDGKDFAYRGGPTYIQQIVTDERIENGLLVSYVQQRYFNKKHNPSKGISDKALDYTFPTEIDLDGHFHLTHDISKDFFFIKSRRGYALMMPANFEVGQTMPASTIIDEIGGGLGSKTTMKRTYTNFIVEKMEQAITPAGTFDCVKLTGDVVIEHSVLGGSEHYDMWIARGIGIVRLDITPVTNKGTGKMYTMYLNHIELK